MTLSDTNTAAYGGRLYGATVPERRDIMCDVRPLPSSCLRFLLGQWSHEDIMQDLFPIHFDASARHKEI